MNTRGDITGLLVDVAAGHTDAQERLARLVYDELRAVAACKLRKQPPGTTLTPTVLVHEAYSRVVNSAGIPLQNRRHLFFAFGQAMWRIVVEYHRRKRLPIIDLDPDQLPAGSTLSTEDVLDLNGALHVLEREYPEEYEIAMMRKALGLSIEETAAVLGMSESSVKQGWALARAHLSRHLSEERTQRRESA